MSTPPVPPSSPTPPQPVEQMPRWIFPVSLAWLVILGFVFALDHLSGDFRSALPDHLGAGIPADVVWFGAIGGCLVSLTGIADHNQDWLRKFNYWHPIRPFVAAITGGVGCLLLLVVTDLADQSGTPEPNPQLYAAVGFVLGYAESAFRSLVKSLIDVIVKPGTPTPPT